MRPVELKLRGFTSFRHPQTIDFSQLELFAITGPVGAGKSSILDALTLALYGKVARGSKPADLLNLGSKILEVGLQFQVTDQEYYVYRKWDYSRTKTAKTSFVFKQLLEGDWQAIGEQKSTEIDVAIQQLLKMDFDTFTRVVLLPQGEFSKFLKGSPKDRREILRQLAGYEIFEAMRSRAAHIAGNLQDDMKRIQASLENLQLCSDEEFQIWQTQLQDYQVQLPQLETQLTQAQLLAKEEQDLLQKIQGLQQLEAELQNHLKQQDQIEAQQQKLTLARAADRIRSTWELLTASRKKYQELQSQTQILQIELEQTQQQFQTQQSALERFQSEALEIRQSISQNRQNLEEANRLEGQLQSNQSEVHSLQVQVNQKSVRIQEQSTELNQANQAVEQVITQLNSLETELKDCVPGGERLEQLQEINPLLPRYILLCQQLAETSQSLHQTQTELDQAQTQLTEIEAIYQQAEADSEQAITDYQQAITQNQAAAIREHLHDGDDCPVCGGTYQITDALPEIADTAQLEKLKKQQTKTQTNLKKAQTEYQKSSSKVEALQTTRSSLEQSYQTQVEQEQSLEQQVSEGLGSFSLASTGSVWAQLLQKAELLTALGQEYQTLQESEQRYQKILQRREQAQTELGYQQKVQSTTQQQLEQLQGELDFLQESLDDKQQTQTRLTQQLENLTGGLSCVGFKQSIDQQETELNQTQEHLSKEVQHAQQQLQQLEANFQATNSQLNTEAQQSQSYETAWETALEAEKLTEVEFLEIRLDRQQQADWEQKIKDFGDRKLQLVTQIQQDQREIGDRTATPETVEQKEQQIQQLRAQLNQIQSEIKQLENQIRQAEQNRQSALEKQQELVTLDQEYQDYSTLAQDLKTNNFQEYILEKFQQDLVGSANLLLWQLSDQRYILHYHKGSYQIEDHWNGGESRSVTSLSGGETFAASLALALALSEKLAKGAQLDSLFIDEGFGTQDENSLEIVIQVLESLRQQQRLVGVISHVPAIGERLGTELRIEKSPEGSQIRVEGILAAPTTVQ